MGLTHRLKSVFIILLLLFFTAVSDVSAEANNILEITSDTMMADNLAKMIIFKGDVKAVYGLMEIQAERINVYMEEKKKGLSRLVASGNVNFSQGEKKISAEEAIYDQGKGVITFTGNVYLSDGKTVVQGKQLTVDLIARQGELSGDVRAVFQPGEIQEIEDRIKKEVIKD